MNLVKIENEASGLVHQYALMLAHKLYQDQDSRAQMPKSKGYFLAQAEDLAQKQYERISAGIHLLYEIMSTSDECHKELLSVTNKLVSDKNLTVENVHKKFFDELLPQKTLAELYGLSDHFLNLAFERGKELVQNDPQKASSLFYSLVLLSPSSYGFWMGLATATYLLQDYFEAAELYKAISELFPEKYDSYLLAAQSYRKMNDIENERQVLAEFLYRFEGSDEVSEEQRIKVKLRLQ